MQFCKKHLKYNYYDCAPNTDIRCRLIGNMQTFNFYFGILLGELTVIICVAIQSKKMCASEGQIVAT